MSYQVLARKWRPKSFDTLVGQEHVVRALTHALQTQRLHHAYLFTGTRGVGKTTIARILAKALNCETGITATPCGQCSACREIDAGRFVDLLEVDAATNTRVDEMRQLLENASYAPTRGRFKVYVIDEVHMLSNSAFNAMLKTLEEPPEHIKFILATTDPQKIPVTVLSRCLQFNLKQMPQAQIVDHIGHILQAEAVPFEPGALRHIAHAANGSMRDALSLLDQAIAHGAGRVEEEAVQAMLGNVGEDHLYALLDALARGDIQSMLATADLMETRSLSFAAALQALATLAHRTAILQFAPDALADAHEVARLQPYAEAFDPEFLQLVYQILIHGRDELPLAPDEYTGFTMTLLRLHAFRPQQPGRQPPPAGSGGAGIVLPTRGAQPALPPARATTEMPAAPKVPPAAPAGAPVPVAEAPARGAEFPVAAPPSPVEVASDVPPWVDEPELAARPVDSVVRQPPAADPVPRQQSPVPPSVQPFLSEGRAAGGTVERPAVEASAASGRPAVTAPEAPAAALADDQGLVDWHALVGRLDVGGLVRELAQNCECHGQHGNTLQLRLGPEFSQLIERNLPERLAEAVSAQLGHEMHLKFEVGTVESDTPAVVERAARARARASAVESLQQDPFVQALTERFGATLVESSVKPLN